MWNRNNTKEKGKCKWNRIEYLKHTLRIVTCVCASESGVGVHRKYNEKLNELR